MSRPRHRRPRRPVTAAIPRTRLADKVPGEHRWVTSAIYATDPEVVHAALLGDNTRVVLGADALVQVSTGCYDCEQVWEVARTGPCPVAAPPSGGPATPTTARGPAGPPPTMDADGLVPAADIVRDVGDAPAGYDVRAGHALDAYAETVGITLDRATLVAMAHGVSAGQALHILTGHTKPDQPGFETEAICAYGTLMWVLRQRIDEAAP